MGWLSIFSIILAILIAIVVIRKVEAFEQPPDISSIDSIKGYYGFDFPDDAYHLMAGATKDLPRGYLDAHLLLFTTFNKAGAFDLRRFNIHARHGRLTSADQLTYFTTGAPLYTFEQLQRNLRPGYHLHLHFIPATFQHGMGIDSNEEVAEELAILAAKDLESITGSYPPPVVLDKLIPYEQLRALYALAARYPSYSAIPSIELLSFLQDNPAITDGHIQRAMAANSSQ